MSCFEKVHGGYKVDGLELKAANCGCGGLTGPGGSGSGDCCFTYSRIKHDAQHHLFLRQEYHPQHRQ